ncbi:MAG: hypothetical protein FWD37_00555 [Methanomassiliicoccaceae archaeon]|nr:hypothetical protein [Methanomassiliicoccaceae archaeon]
MTVWLCRAGLRGEYENKFIDQNAVYLIGSVSIDLTGRTDAEELSKLISSKYPLSPDGSVTSMTTQARAFATKVKIGDWVVVPSASGERLLNIGEVTGKYAYDGSKSELKHSHSVDWKYGAWKREDFDEDIVRSLDAFDTFMVFFKLKQEKRIKEIVGKGKPMAPVAKPKKKSVNKPETEPIEETEPAYDNNEIKDMIEDLKRTIAEVKATITEVKKATLTEAVEVKRVIAEVRNAIESSENASATVYFESEGDDDIRCPCGRNGVVCYKYNKMYYDMLKGRRCYRR